MSGTAVRYEWTKDYGDKEKALDAATWIHEALKEEDDYIESRILLHVGEFGSVELYEFKDSNTHVHVSEEDGHPVLDIFKR